MISMYAYYENKSHDKYARRSIDGSTIGCSKCVGYCRFEGHEGFLSKKQRQSHDCLGKECFYYIPKTKEIKDKHVKAKVNFDSCVDDVLSAFEGIRSMKVEQDENGTYIVKYISITAAHSISDIENRLSESLGKRTVRHNR